MVAIRVYFNPLDADCMKRMNKGRKRLNQLMAEQLVDVEEVRMPLDGNLLMDKLVGKRGVRLPRWFIGNPEIFGWASKPKVNNGGYRWLDKWIAENIESERDKLKPEPEPEPEPEPKPKPKPKPEPKPEPKPKPEPRTGKPGGVRKLKAHNDHRPNQIGRGQINVKWKPSGKGLPLTGINVERTQADNWNGPRWSGYNCGALPNGYVEVPMPWRRRHPSARGIGYPNCKPGLHRIRVQEVNENGKGPWVECTVEVQ